MVTRFVYILVYPWLLLIRSCAEWNILPPNGGLPQLSSTLVSKMIQMLVALQIAHKNTPCRGARRCVCTNGVGLELGQR